jgi:hypothetical protein
VSRRDCDTYKNSSALSYVRLKSKRTTVKTEKRTRREAECWTFSFLGCQRRHSYPNHDQYPPPHRATLPFAFHYGPPVLLSSSSTAVTSQHLPELGLFRLFCWDEWSFIHHGIDAIILLQPIRASRRNCLAFDTARIVAKR